MDFTVAVPLVSRYLQSDASATQRATIVSDIVQLLNSGEANILSVVGALQDCLTSDDSSRRAQGTQLLAQVLSDAGSVLSQNDLHHLSIFMAARLSDWPCTEPAAEGCTTLLQLLHQALPNDKTDDALVIVRAATTDLSGHVQQLSQKDRAAALQLLITATQLWGSPSALAGINLVDALIGAIDGEKDPRCLLLTFNLVQAVAQVYHQPGVDPSPWVSQCEEVVEVLSCYFPLTFNPPKTDPHKITREQLASSLMSSLTASPFMTGWVLPLVLEKLSSTYRPAQLDALAALAAAFSNYGPEALQPHLTALWSGLRSVLLGPTQLSGGSSRSDGDDVWQLAELAATCLTAACRAMQGGELQQLVMQDEQVLSQLLVIVGGGATAAHSEYPSLGIARDASSIMSSTFQHQDNQLIACAKILGAVAAAGPSPAGQVLSAAIPALLDCMSQPPSSKSHTTGQPAPDLDTTNSSSSRVIPPGCTKQWYILAACQHILLMLTDSSSQGPGAHDDEMIGVLRPWVARLWDVTDHIVHQLSSALQDPRLSNTKDIEMIEAGHDQISPLPDDDTALQVMISACTLIKTLIALQHSHGRTAALLSYQQLLPVAETMCSLSLIADPSLPLSQGTAATRMVVHRKGNDTTNDDNACKPTEAALEVVKQILVACSHVEESSSNHNIAAILTQHIMQQLTVLHTSKVQSGGAGSQAAAGLQHMSWQQAIYVCTALSGTSSDMARHAVQQVAHMAMRLMSELRGGSQQHQSVEMQHVAISCLKDILQLAVSCIASSGVESSPASCGSTIAAAAALAQCCMQHEAAATIITTTISAEVTGAVDLLAAIATCAGYMTSCCDASEQRVLAKHAEQLLLGSVNSTQQGVPVTACTVLAAVRQGVMPDTRIPDLVSRLMSLGSNCHTTSPSPTAAAAAVQVQALAVCLAALINKATDLSEFERQASSILQQFGLNPSAGINSQQQQQQASLQLRDWGMQALTWVICAAAHRGSPMTTPAIQSLIMHVAAEAQQINSIDKEVPMSLNSLEIGRTSSTAFRQVRLMILWHRVVHKLFATSSRPANVTTNPAHQSDTVATWHHIVCRPLWQQRTLNGCLPFLISLLQQHRTHEALHACFASLLATVPPPLIKQHVQQLLPHIGDTAATLLKVLLESSAEQETVICDASLRTQRSQLFREQLAGILRFLYSMLNDASFRTLFETEVGGLLPTISAICTLKGNPVLREQAVSFLMLCAQQLPYHVLHPSSHAVLKAVSAALDDDRRSVRQLAAKARRVWSQK